MKPSIAGKPRVGRILTARPGTWPAGVRLSYRWLADGKAVKGGTGKRLEVTRALVGTRVSVRVTARLPGYRAATARSARTGKVSALRSVRTAP